MKTDKKVIIMALLGFFVMPICAVIISNYYFSRSDRKVEVRQKIDVKDEVVGTNALSIYLETAEGSGEYTLSDSDVFLQDGYYFNEEKSKCENGGLLSFDESTGKVRMTASASDRCYVYFNKGPSIGKVCKNQNLAQCIKENYTIDGSIYYHNETLDRGAEDNSYRYAGGHDTVNNFVCFGTDAENCPNDNLYRIIGVFGDKVKLIKYDYATKEQFGTGGDYSREVSPDATYYRGSQNKVGEYYWNSANTKWSKSKLNTVNLNGTYLNNLGTAWTNKIATTTWNIGDTVSGWEIMFNNAKSVYNIEFVYGAYDTYEAKIGLMYVSEYFYGSLPIHWYKIASTTAGIEDYSTAVDDNWMYMGLSELPISAYVYEPCEPPAPVGPAGSGEEDIFETCDDLYNAYYIYDFGYVGTNSKDVGSPIRPTFSLIPSVELASGSGTKSDPFRIKLT